MPASRIASDSAALTNRSDGGPDPDFSCAADREAFAAKVWQQGKLLYRDLPWRATTNPYEVYLSEVMLQQTQVARVIKYWTSFLKAFPTIDALAAADDADVLERWQGLGYNRRGLALKRCATVCSAEYGGRLPDSYDQLIALPGIGPSTAAGILAFAYNRPGVYLETNVRTVFIHEWFANESEPITDKQLIPMVEQTCDTHDVRGWYYALLDYGAYLKKILPNPSRRSAHHAKQSTYVGSRRQKRAEILRLVLDEPGIAPDELQRRLSEIEIAENRSAVATGLFEGILADLCAEGFLKKCEGGLRI